VPSSIRVALNRAKLTYLWITRILFAPNHFSVPLFKRVYFAVAGGYTCDQVGRYGLTPFNKKKYLSEFDWYRSRNINAPFDSMLNNKIACNEVLRHHIKVPAIDFVKNRGRLVALSDTSMSAEAATVLEGLHQRGCYFLKPLAAGKGKGVHRLDYLEGSYRLDGQLASPEELVELLNQQDGWFLSEGINQHPLLAGIFPHTTNTLRMITLRNDDGQAELFFVVLRLGTTGTIPVDNGSRGGLVAKVDLDSGAVSHATSLWSEETFTHHPDSDMPIEGLRLPDWHELRRSIISLAEALPYLQFVAWDVLLTEAGPVIIEANTSSGVNIIQVWGSQRHHRLGDFYRTHGVNV